MMYLDTALHVEEAQHFPHRRVGDVACRLRFFDFRVDYAEAMLEEGRQMAAGNVAELINGGREDGAAVLAVPRGIVAAAAEKRDPKRGSADNHGDRNPFQSDSPNPPPPFPKTLRWEGGEIIPDFSPFQRSLSDCFREGGRGVR